MARVAKMIKDKNGTDIEVYADTCVVCNREMIFPKKEADYLDSLFPFLKEKLDNGSSPCVVCFDSYQKTTGKAFFSEEETKLIEQAAKNSEQQ